GSQPICHIGSVESGGVLGGIQFGPVGQSGRIRFEPVGVQHRDLVAHLEPAGVVAVSLFVVAVVAGVERAGGVVVAVCSRRLFVAVGTFLARTIPGVLAESVVGSCLPGVLAVRAGVPILSDLLPVRPIPQRFVRALPLVGAGGEFTEFPVV